MEQERYDNIEYNEEWQSVHVERAEPIKEEYRADDDDIMFDNDDYEAEKNVIPTIQDIKNHLPEIKNPQPVIKLQLLISIIALAGAFLLKNLGGDIYTMARQWYFENLDNSLVATLQGIAGQSSTEIPSEKSTIIPTEISSVLVVAPTEVVTELPTEQETESITENSTFLEDTEESNDTYTYEE